MERRNESWLFCIEVFHTSTCIRDTLKILFTENSNRYEIVISASYLQQQCLQSWKIVPLESVQNFVEFVTRIVKT